MVVLEYSKCSTCRKALQWLKINGVEYTERAIEKENPTVEELKKWIPMSGLPLRKFFNTSGLQYRALGLKDKLAELSEEEMIALLASDGMLVKRPLVIGDDFVLVGFKEDEWKKVLLEK